MVSFMETKAFFKKYLPAVLALAAIALVVSGFWFAGYLSEKSFDRTIDNLHTGAQNEVKQAANASNAAASAQMTRSIEDGVREQVIAPKLETARRRSQSSRIELEKAQTKYDNEKITHPRVSNSRAVNCVQLKRLYPNTRFEYCDRQN